MLKKSISFLGEYLRINAIRRMFALVDVRRREIIGLISLAAVFAVFEGIGLSLLLPILQYAESGQTAITDSSGAVWSGLGRLMEALGLPVTLPVLLLMAFIPILLRQVVFYVNAWYSAIVSGRIALRMRMQALDAILDADPEFFTRHALGKIVGVVLTQTSAAGQAVLLVIKQLSVVLLMALYIALLLAVSVPLTAITAAFALLVSAVVRTNVVRTKNYAVEAARVSQELSNRIVERFAMIRLIKLRDQKRQESDRIADHSETMRDISVRQARLAANMEVTADPLLMLSAFVTLYVGIEGLQMTLAQLGLVLFVLSRLNAKVKEFNAGRQLISYNVAGLLLVNEMTDDARASDTIKRGQVAFDGIRQEIRIENVSFDYPDTFESDGSMIGSGKQVLRDVSLVIPAGSFTALVGRSGGGKSTLVELLPRLRDVSGGRILVDGVDIREFDVGSLRRGIGYLTQSAMLFNDTVRENLVYGLDHDPGDDRLRQALEDAYAAFVYDLPEGIQTRIGDRGVRFSGGERQRIALARVLLEDTSVLVLDEPTSALDSESEEYIQQALARLHGKKTIIVIAHRLATVRQADQIVVIDDGMVAECGTHEELMDRGELYQRLFESQLM
ncbi:MAG: ABC transporter ATP-binding protein [Coriobacteriia bacterium]|nr:ABC transporter ATP-binding protein [Coriobacteriia bacterium]